MVLTSLPKPLKSREESMRGIRHIITDLNIGFVTRTVDVL